jgi:coenzyme PQQ precursor peptide PqqA
MRLVLIDASAYILSTRPGDNRAVHEEERAMKVWTKPAVREQEVGLEVTSYLPAEIDII